MLTLDRACEAVHIQASQLAGQVVLPRWLQVCLCWTNTTDKSDTGAICGPRRLWAARPSPALPLLYVGGRSHPSLRSSKHSFSLERRPANADRFIRPRSVRRCEFRVQRRRIPPGGRSGTDGLGSLSGSGGWRPDSRKRSVLRRGASAAASSQKSGGL